MRFASQWRALLTSISMRTGLLLQVAKADACDIFRDNLKGIDGNDSDIRWVTDNMHKTCPAIETRQQGCADMAYNKPLA